MDGELVIKRLSERLDQNSRSEIQRDIKRLFNHGEFWKERNIPGLSAKHFDSFRDFAIYTTPWGLGWTVKVLEAFILPELKEIWQEIEGEISEAKENHRPKKEGSVIYNSYENNRGTSREHAIAVLKRDAPAIAKKVVAGEISAAEGMRQAGKRKQTVTHDITVEGFQTAIEKKLSPKEIKQLKKWINENY